MLAERAASEARGERPGALLARRTRTIRMCSFDARSKGQPWPLPYGEVERVGWPSLGWMGDKGRAVEID